MDRSLETVGFIGFGQMGGGMVAYLLLAGVDLMVYDLRQYVSQKYVQLGARIAKSLNAIDAKVKKIFLCLPLTHEVDVALFGTDSVDESAEKGLMILDMSTIHVSDALAFQTRLKAFELSYFRVTLLSSKW